MLKYFVFFEIIYIFILKLFSVISMQNIRMSNYKNRRKLISNEFTMFTFSWIYLAYLLKWSITIRMKLNSPSSVKLLSNSTVSTWYVWNHLVVQICFTTLCFFLCLWWVWHSYHCFTYSSLSLNLFGQ